MSKGEGNDGNADIMHREGAVMVLMYLGFHSLITLKMSNFTRNN